MIIKSISIRKILNSAAAYTIETTITLGDGSTGIASIPGGISKGTSEVATLSPNEAIKRVGDIKNELDGKDFKSLKDLDDYLIQLDGTANKSKLGGNTTLSISMATAKAHAKSLKLETYEYIHMILNPDVPVTEVEFRIPQMMMLILEGGLHGGGSASIQEFMAIVDNVDRGLEIYKNVENELRRLSKSTNVGAEGAFSPQGYDNDQVLSLLTGYLHGEKIAIDVAANSFAEMPNNPQLPNYDVLLKNYPIASIEDPYREDDWVNWELFGNRYTENLIVVTDDLTTTNPKLLQEAINKDVGNAILVKPNQIGTVSETLRVIDLARQNGWQIVVSHRGTDTNDDFIADLAVGAGAEFVKFGAPSRGERVAKYNRLLEIEES